MRHGGGEVLRALRSIAGAAVELAEAEVAVGQLRTHRQLRREVDEPAPVRECLIAARLFALEGERLGAKPTEGHVVGPRVVHRRECEPPSRFCLRFFWEACRQIRPRGDELRTGVMIFTRARAGRP